jgi:diguanylate cyclase (GGDEF)-like protein
VLLVEDSPVVARVVGRKLLSVLEREVIEARSLGEARDLLEKQGADFLAAVVDLGLPDAPEGEIVDLTIEAGVPTVVMTGSGDEQTRERILAKNIVDYYFKGDQSLDALADTVRRLDVNRWIKVLVVDDSATSRGIVARLLTTHRFQVLEAADGEEALGVLESNPDIALVITDFEMPNMNGIELVGNVRSRRGADELAVVGVSSLGSSALTARFLKFGADDFLTKPFQKEEFYCRVYRSIKNLEQIQAIKRSAYTDQLTGLHNRLYFFQKAPPLYDTAAAHSAPLAVAMLDIDFFKKINDTHGHAAGDAALQQVAELLQGRLLDPMILARFGGEEFCIFAPGLEEKRAEGVFERMRAALEARPVAFEDEQIPVTLSIGVALDRVSSLDTMINRADEFLYQAKESGRNRVVIEGREVEREAEPAP